MAKVKEGILVRGRNKLPILSLWEINPEKTTNFPIGLIKKL
jgi:hypothetical protein